MQRMRMGLSFMAVVLLSAAALSATKVVVVIGKMPDRVQKLIGKRVSSKPLKNGLLDVYRVPGFYDVRFSYIGLNKNQRPYDVRLTFASTVTPAQALSAAGIRAEGYTSRQNPLDGSTLIEHVSGAPAGWAISFWTDHNRTPRSHLDFTAPHA